MSLDFANSNVNRNFTLAGTSVAIFTFLLFFLYPKYSDSTIDPILFQLTISVIVSVIFCVVISASYYYATWLTLTSLREGTPIRLGKADGMFVLGFTLLLLEPSLILFTVNLPIVAIYGLALWFAYLGITGMLYRRVLPKKK